MARTDIIIVEGKAYTAGQIVDAIAALADIKTDAATAISQIKSSPVSAWTLIFVTQIAKLANAVDTAPVA